MDHPFYWSFQYFVGDHCSIPWLDHPILDYGFSYVVFDIESLNFELLLQFDNVCTEQINPVPTNIHFKEEELRSEFWAAVKSNEILMMLLMYMLTDFG